MQGVHWVSGVWLTVMRHVLAVILAPHCQKQCLAMPVMWFTQVTNKWT